MNSLSHSFDAKLGVHHRPEDMTFIYDKGIFGPEPEFRYLDAIRASLRDPQCNGPDPVYSIVMDVGREEHCEELQRRMLLFGVVAYAAGQLGEEPVRSQGHIHAVAPHCGWSTPELFEIWRGRAIIYMQQTAADDPGKCFAIEARPGDQVVVPPGWAHAVINADPTQPMVFGAWCDRQYGFVYDQVRAHHGLAWFPLVTRDGELRWEPNFRYQGSKLVVRRARTYPELGVDAHLPIYEQFARTPEAIQWVADPARYADLWPQFQP